ncbi:hypothetical protein BX666DRAFT_1984570 [Dichotomocladium elegans]|nr:hypothetical protein BX666DRAFT_1984570 [Dichotomocladium elegans]
MSNFIHVKTTQLLTTYIYFKQKSTLILRRVHIIVFCSCYTSASHWGLVDGYRRIITSILHVANYSLFFFFILTREEAI